MYRCTCSLCATKQCLLEIEGSVECEQWQTSTYVNNHKYKGPACHHHLSNNLMPRHLCPLDFKRLSSSTYQPTAASAAFTRVTVLLAMSMCVFGTCRPVYLLATVVYRPGQDYATLGWNGSTTPSFPNIQPAKQAGPCHHKHVKYVSPLQHATAVTDTIRAAKYAPALQMHEWTRKYGKEGAAAMQQLMPVQHSNKYKVRCCHHATKMHLSIWFC